MKITLLRKKMNLTQAALAQASETTQQQIALIERGHSDPRLSTLYKIAAALSVEIGELFFTIEEFLEVLNRIIRNDFGGKTPSLRELNIYCGENHNISPYDPNWSKIEINRSNKITQKKGE